MKAVKSALLTLGAKVQSTLTLLESGTGEAEVIKSHHNVGGLPAVVDFKGLIEPLRNLFKGRKCVSLVLN